MKMDIKGKEIRISMNQHEAVELIGRLAQTVNQAGRHKQWVLSLPMAIGILKEKLDHPGIVYLDVSLDA